MLQQLRVTYAERGVRILEENPSRSGGEITYLFILLTKIIQTVYVADNLFPLVSQLITLPFSARNFALIIDKSRMLHKIIIGRGVQGVFLGFILIKSHVVYPTLANK